MNGNIRLFVQALGRQKYETFTKRHFCSFQVSRESIESKTLTAEKQVKSKRNDGVWIVEREQFQGKALLEYQRKKGVQAVQKVFDAIAEARKATNDDSIWDNYGYRENLLCEWLRDQYGFNDLRRSKGRSGPDCITTDGKRSNIEIKTSKFVNRRNFTAAYEIGQFCRQNVPQIRESVLSIDAMVYGIFARECVSPLLVFCLHSDMAIERHKQMLIEKQEEFQSRKRKRGENTPKGGRDTCKIYGGDLCRILSRTIRSKNEKIEPVSGFDVWLRGKHVNDWNSFAKSVLYDKGINLLE